LNRSILTRAGACEILQPVFKVGVSVDDKNGALHLEGGSRHA
jgi:hypothetical protein